jgi:methylenetetrahydrofolate reductase (NADPH)
LVKEDSMSVSQLQQKFENGSFVVTGETGPPKGTNVHQCLHRAQKHLKGRCNAVNVTDNQSAIMRTGSLAFCRLLMDRGMEPVFQMVCRDRNSIALQSDALSAYALGIRNILAITGDHQALGDHPQASGVFDMDSVSLLNALSGLEAGRDICGNALDGAPKFCKGAVVTPCAEPVEPQIIKMEKKIEAGAQFFQTQAVYDIKQFETFMKRVEKFNVPVLAGQVILKSAGMARFLNANVSGINVPEHLVSELKKDKEAAKSGKTGARICADFVKEAKAMCQGVHLMTLGWDHLVPDIFEMADLG